ncbi:MAG: RIO-type serine/threonine-protein kinase Rio1 [Methanomassiliicoccales archaeon PtaB.Bin215]|nr:MAG: RIO-type serine/threonine-protein kinase Rio1 [Methanomassiliicoccales archaeon PtaB.Bin215]
MPQEDKNILKLDRKVEKLRLTRSFESSQEGRKVMEEVFDNLTLGVIFKLTCEKRIASVDFPVSTGKEGNVFRATAPDGTLVALKIYRTSNATFKNISKYIEGDTRFKGLTGNPRKLIYAWCTKEFKNLNRLEQAGVRVPHPRRFMKNIIVMDYLGDAVMAAPQLRSVRLDEPQKVYREIIRFMKRAFQKAKLVHGDLSEYNILMHDGMPYIIDCGQAMLTDHPNAIEFLKRDVKNINRYFRNLDIKVWSDETVLKYVQGVREK